MKKFFIGNWPDDISFKPDETWTPMKEPTNLWITQLLALPFLVVNLLVVYGVANLVNIGINYKSGYFLLGFLLFIPIHEVIHALIFPEPLSSNNVKFGFFPKKLVFFAFYTKEMSRNRFIFVMLAPFLIITLTSLLSIILLGGNILIENILLGNAVASCVDIMNIFLLLTQVPAKATVRNKKIRTFWKIK